MLKTYFKLIAFARPLAPYTIPYFFFALFYALFNTFNYAMIIPILNTMFGKEFDFKPIYEAPALAASAESYNAWVSYIYTNLFGAEFKVQNMLILLAFFTVLMTLSSNTFRFLCAYTVERLKATTLEKLKNKLFDHVMGMSVGFFSEQRKGDIMAKITGDVGVVQFCITNTLQVAFKEPFLIVGYIAAMIVISWQLSVFSILFLPIVAVIIGSIVKRLRKPAKQAMELGSDMTSILDESLSGVKIIKSYNATDYIKSRYHAINRRVAELTLSMARRQQMASPMSEVLGVSAIGVIIVFGGGLVASGELDAAQFLAFIAIFSQITRPVRSFIDQFATINQGVAAGERVLNLLAEENPMKESETPKDKKTFENTIEFKDVSFSYDGQREVLSKINFTIEKGQTVALVGPSGGGKSTISELIPRFYDPTSGEVLIDGVSLRDMREEDIRSLVGTVAQDTILFNDTILANLAFGRLGATREEVIAAARIANAHDFINDALDGYDTNIGDRGLKLSGGQRQRLSIARAVLKNPDILILDEATSALDTQSEKMVQESLTRLLKGRTSLVIAHRLSTIHSADKILVVDRGQLVEQGTHSELMQLDGVYKRLVEMQSFE